MTPKLARTNLSAAAALSLVMGSHVLGQSVGDPAGAGHPRAIPGPVLPIPPDLPTGSGTGGPGGGGADGPGFDLNWFTIDGGGATYLLGDDFALGATAGQPDAGFMSGGDFELGGGFWYGVITIRCYANCDLSTIQPILNVLDFSCFLNKFAAGDSYANCDNSTIAPVLNVLDFSCFLNAFAAGCS